MTRQFSAIAMSAIVVLLNAPAQGNDPNDFLRLLEARNNSIASFEIRLRRTGFAAKLEDHAPLTRTFEKATQKSNATDAAARAWVETLLQEWSEKPSWITEHMHQRGDCFKHIRTFREGEQPDIDVYDGQLHYDYSQISRQLDIHTQIPNISRADLQNIGIMGGKFRKQAQLVSLEQDQGRTRCVISWHSNRSNTVDCEYDRHLGLRYRGYESSAESRSDDYYLFHRNVDGHSIPRVRVHITRNARRKECRVHVYVIEEVRINCPLADEDLCLGDVPDRVLVIDYRFEPLRQYRYSEYRQTAANPHLIRAGQGRPEDFLDMLHRTSGQRKAHTRRNSRVGRPAPQPQIDEWLMIPPKTDDWPPQKFTVLNFCSMSCGFCVSEIPENKELAQWLKTQGALFRAIHPANEQSYALVDFMNQHRIDYLVGLDRPSDQTSYWGSATFAEYGVNGIPAYVTVSKDGRVLSYDRSPTPEQLQKLMTADPSKIVPQERGSQSPAVTPTAWFEHNLEPRTQVETRFFAYCPETPDLDLRRSERDNDSITCDWERHSDDGQTVYEVRLAAKTPDWGKTLEGRLALIARHDNLETPLVIPYKLRSQNLVEWVSPIVWFGCVAPGATVTRPLSLQLRPGQEIEIKKVSLPVGVAVRHTDGDSDTVVLDLAFSSSTPGLHRGMLKLLASDATGNRQPVSFGCCAFVQTPQ